MFTKLSRIPSRLLRSGLAGSADRATLSRHLAIFTGASCCSDPRDKRRVVCLHSSQGRRAGLRVSPWPSSSGHHTQEINPPVFPEGLVARIVLGWGVYCATCALLGRMCDRVCYNLNVSDIRDPDTWPVANPLCLSIPTHGQHCLYLLTWK